MEANARSFYRVVYPDQDRPDFEIPYIGPTPVIDCSERGLMYVPSGWRTPRVGDRVEGTIHLHRGGVEVRGRVVRSSPDRIALLLEEPGIPTGLLIGEQLYLRSRYSGWPGRVASGDRR